MYKRDGKMEGPKELGNVMGVPADWRIWLSSKNHQILVQFGSPGVSKEQAVALVDKILKGLNDG